MARGDKLTLSDIDQWIDNDEGLYNWWKQSRQGKRAFVRENRAEIERAIQAMTSGTRRQHYLAYGGSARVHKAVHRQHATQYYAAYAFHTYRVDNKYGFVLDWAATKSGAIYHDRAEATAAARRYILRLAHGSSTSGNRSRGSRSSRVPRLHHYYTILIAKPRRGATKWHPRERTGPFHTISRGAFRTQRAAHAWAKLHLGGTRYRLKRFKGA